MSREKQIEGMACAMCGQDKICGGVGVEKCIIYSDYRRKANRLYNVGYRKIPQNIGEFSDGYHTFNELYHHRAVLFSVICNMFPEKSWKSKLHDTGDMYEGMFIVGIETEQGQATYHYDIEPYWDMFKVKELEKAPKYDGHTPSDAIKRIGNLTCAGYRKQGENETLEAVDKFRSALMNKFIDICGGNDYNKINLLRIGDTIQRTFYDVVARLKGGAE